MEACSTDGHMAIRMHQLSSGRICNGALCIDGELEKIEVPTDFATGGLKLQQLASF
jgi:hypothetical protein